MSYTVTIMKKILIILSSLIIAFVLASGVLTWMYTSSEEYTSDYFDNSTFINGVNCSSCTYEETEKKLVDNRNEMTVVMKGDLDDVLAVYRDFDFTYDIDSAIADVKRDHPVAAAFNHYLGIPLSVSVSMNITEDNGNLKEQIENTPFIKSKSTSESQNAYVDLSDPSFPIINEVYGTKPDVNKLYEDLVKTVEIGERVFTFEENDYLDIPDIKSDNEKLLKHQRFCLEYLGQKIEYKLGSETFTIPAEELETLMDDDYSGNADPGAVRNYVAALGEKYDNAGKDRSFKSLTGKDVSVKGGTYGWRIDTDKETDKLTADINSHKDVSREPIWAFEGYGDYSDDLGDTYVDADLGAQHVTVFKDGKNVFECDFVSGNEVMGHSTPTGSFYIVNHFRNLVLRGDNDDGTQYESPVKYWCGFYMASHGFHDADWRNSFGGTIYIRNGSHGCINMPPSKMGEFYDTVVDGMPVIVHR